ncbi:DUF4864 domain-containing protein [Pontibacter arcticus]|uniref:DUF4864 domain-containing protein n=1 Tax=Pontibacter arcticus TaxID=2080288 RepID=A0A364RB93_9BACT|nr:DUF4864 domain-containing protein [Pontibacter arcticus]RAU81563.1 hypothetical protein DP923_15795 [Pontibacter arcticus]
MKTGLDYVFDKLMLVTGILLLLYFWANFPERPQEADHHYATLSSPGSSSKIISKWAYVKPDKQLSPREVIRIQLMALQQNDNTDSGVLTVFNFSSPTSRMHLGHINNFRVMVREPAYKPMLNFRKYKTGQLVVTDNIAYQLILITDQQQQQNAYLFILSKQKKGPYKGCWMTDGVTRMAQGPASKQI